MSKLTLNLSTAPSSISTSKPRLKPWEIHQVIIKECGYKQIEGKKEPGKVYDTISILFESTEGTYEHTIFALREEDGDRRLNSNNKEMPSNFENFIHLVGQIGQVCSPDSYEKLKNHTFDFAKPEGFKTFAAAFGKVMQPAIGKTFYLKLIGDKNNNPRLPYFVGLNQEGETFVASNFISTEEEKLFFSTYEMGSKARVESAKPTNMNSVQTGSQGSEDVASDIDFDL